MALALAAWVAVIVLARVWGLALLEDGRELALRAVPLYGRWDPLLTWRVAPAVAVAAAVVVVGPPLARRLPWRSMLAAVAVAGVVWALALALVDGTGAVTDPLEHRHEYLPFARTVDDVGEFLDTFTDRIEGYPTHVRGHPPGMVTLLVLLDRVGLAGTGVVAGIVVVGGALALVAALVLVRHVAGETAARAAAPYLVLLPAAIWVATTADALFAGVGLGGVAALAVASGRRGGATTDVLALGAGALLGVAVHLSYGLVLLVPLVAAAVLPGRPVRALALAVAGGIGMTVAFLLAGFAWWDGLAATQDEYRKGIASTRPYAYSFVGNLAVLALVTGPAVTAGAAFARRGLARVVGAATVAVAIALVSGLSKGEVERIWLFLVPPLAVAAGALPRTRTWLAVQATTAITLAVLLRTAW